RSKRDWSSHVCSSDLGCSERSYFCMFLSPWRYQMALCVCVCVCMGCTCYCISGSGSEVITLRSAPHRPHRQTDRKPLFPRTNARSEERRVGTETTSEH